jgi:Leucine Rich repeat
MSRLIYADWLEETGQPERAEMIRLQCNPQSGNHPREMDLTKAIGAQCPETMRKQVERWYFKRGLLQASVTMRVFQSKAFQEQAPEWIRQARVHGLTLRGTTKHWQKVADSPVLAHVHELALAGVHTLRIQQNGIRHGLMHLAAVSTLPRLRRLELPDNHVTLESLHALAGWPQASRLTSLDLQTNWLSAAEASVLFNSPHLSGLTVLSLYYCRIGDPGARALASSPHMAGLRRLHLGCCGIGADGVRFLGESPYLRRLQYLSLLSNPLGDEGVSALLASPQLCEVPALALSRSGLSEESIARLRQHLGERLQLNQW